ncbi:MAG: oxygen-independent coproporphyrinogen III oxidase [Bacteroidetes bacterium]|nr:oxygen-independent coproporphyrinogen III oxidase [Bacteroidota bacterium]MBU1115906.1 oxygen-independent coproporphyrinogen III oxidase [Bacteroidota bacterium]MBU1798735.1 oxygen-independent coproporphyrinogen III oxidase [Bacteroidota bacterium]
MFNIDIELIKKYDKPGPRYTSYPTAPHFSEEFSDQQYVSAIKENNSPENKTPLSLYFHIPFCDTLCYFCGCNMIISNNRGRVANYVDYVKKEIALLKTHLANNRIVTQLHWGGGTPTHLKPEEIKDLLSYINANFDVDKNAEASCEIDPRELTFEHLKALREGGFNRISMGVQDFTHKVQVAVNRIQPEDITRKAVDWVRELKFQSINLDLMYGLPHQTLETFSETLEKIIDISPNRIAVFNYAHVPWMKKHMELINPEDLPTPDVKLQILKYTIERLTEAGYVFIGMDHFAKPDDELAIALSEKKLYRNFQGYSTQSGTDLYALGITSISQFSNIYSQNIKTEKEYFEKIDNGFLPLAKGYLMSDDDVLRRDVIMSLMCDFELKFKTFEEKYNINFKKYFANGLEKINQFVSDDLVLVEHDNIKVTEMGRLLIRNIAMCFDAFLEDDKGKVRYSRTV